MKYANKNTPAEMAFGLIAHYENDTSAAISHVTEKLDNSEEYRQAYEEYWQHVLDVINNLPKN